MLLDIFTLFYTKIVDYFTNSYNILRANVLEKQKHIYNNLL